MTENFVAQNQRRIPIRRRVLLAVLLTTVIAILVAICASVIVMFQIRDESKNALTEQLKHNLTNIIEQKAAIADNKLERYEKYINLVTDYISELYEDKSAHMKLGHYIDAPRSSTGEGVFALTGALSTEAVKVESVLDDMRFLSNLEQVWSPIIHENDDIITTMYAGTRTGFLASYDKWSYISAAPEGEYLYYDYLESGWFRLGLTRKGIFYTGLYTDSQGRGLTITIGSAYRDEKGIAQGVTCADFDITGLFDEMISVNLGNGGYSFAIGSDKSIISPDSEGVSAKEYTRLSTGEIAVITSGARGILETRDAFYVYAPVARVGWTLCACVPREVVLERVRSVDQTILVAIFLFVAVALLIVVAITLVSNRLARSITQPMEMLEQDMKIIADGNLEHKATVCSNDEVGDMTDRLNEMVEKLKSTLVKLADTEQHAEAMTELANKDALTGIRNKTAYDKQVKNIEWELTQGKTEFGFAMIDLNFLKRLNDTFGHDKGNIAIKKLCGIVCTIFDHSPVFRIGGDEFVVILKGQDYDNVESLVARFKKTVTEYSEDAPAEPWERISAAIGYALFDAQIDSSVDNVFKRADNAMYECKKAMRAIRE